MYLFYDESYTLQEDIEDLIKATYIEGLNLKFRYLKAGATFSLMKPIDFTLIKSSDEFKNYLSYTWTVKLHYKNIYKNFLKVTRDLIVAIEKEIIFLKTKTRG